MSCILVYREKNKQYWISDGKITTLNEKGDLLHENGYSKIRILNLNKLLIGYSGNLDLMKKIYQEVSSFKHDDFIFQINKLSSIVKDINFKYKNAGCLDNSTAIIIGGMAKYNFLTTIYPDGKTVEVQKFALLGDGSKYIHKKLLNYEYKHEGFNSLIELFKESWESEFCNKEMYLYKIDNRRIVSNYKNYEIIID